MRPKVFITRPIPKDVEAYIAQYCDYEIWDSADKPISRPELFEKIADVDGLMTTGGKINAELLEHAPKLKIVSNISVGYNNFDIAAMKERQVFGTNTPSVLNDTVADLVLGLMLSCARRIPELDRYVREGRWEPRDDQPLFGVDVHHATLGIIGMGRIGEEIVKRAKYGFDMNVVYYNRRRKPDVEAKFGIEYASFDELLSKSDFVVIMTPLTPETTHLMGKEQFAQMKNSAIFINASRGQTVDEAALIDALQSGQIYAAGLDVFEKEPIDRNSPLLQLPNAVLLPHVGSATTKTRFNMAMTAAKNLVAAVTGGKPENIVDELK